MTAHDHAYAAFVGIFGREPTSTEMREVLDLMFEHMKSLACPGYERLPPQKRPRTPKPQRPQILDTEARGGDSY